MNKSRRRFPGGSHENQSQRKESVHRPRFGSGLDRARWRNQIEADIDEGLRKDVVARGVALEVVNPWNFYLGSFEGIHVDRASGTLTACGDPRRASQAEGV